MAFGGRELRLILSIQSYGTSNLARLRRDIMALEASTKTANINQLRVQDQILRKAEQATRIQDRIDSASQASAARRSKLLGRMAQQELLFGQRREKQAIAELAMADRVGAKRLQIGRSQDRINQMQTVGMQRFGVQEANLATRRLRIQQQMALMPAKELSLSSRILSNKAAILARERQLHKLLGQSADLTQMATGNLGNYGSRVKEIAYRYRSALATQKALTIQQKELPRQAAIYQSQLTGIVEQEKLIQAGKTAQAAAIGRQIELTALQSGELNTIMAKQAQIQGQIAMIDQQEALVNDELREQLGLLESENAALTRQRVLLGQLQAEMQQLNTQGMAAARAEDARTAKLAALGGAEARARQMAHIGRTAQFSGLIASAAFATASNSFANFSERASLAATQMRDVGATFEQTGIRSRELQDRILDLGMEFPASAEEMSEAAYEIFSSMNIVRNGVVDTALGFDLLTKANQAAVAGGVELEEATKAMIIVMNNFDPTLSHSTELLNQMFSVVRFGNMRLSDLGTAMNSLAPIAKTVGLEFSDVGAAFATLTILTGKMETASTGLARALELFRIPAFRKGFEAWGVATEDVHGNLLSLDKLLANFAKRFPETTTGQKAMVEAFIQVSKASGLTKAGIQGTIQARRAWGLLVTSLDLYRNILGNVTKNQDEFNEALTARKLDPGVQWQIFLRQMQTLVLVVGREAIPVFLAVGDRIADFVRWLKDLNPEVRKSIIGFSAWAGVALLLGGTVLSVVASIKALQTNIAIMTVLSGGAVTKFTLLRGAILGIVGLGFFILIQQLTDLETAVTVTTTAFLVWKVRAIQSIWAVATAMVAGSAVAGAAIRTALLRTGVGAILVFAGYMLTTVDDIEGRWNQLLAFFQGLWAAIMMGWSEAWNFISATGKAAVGEIAGHFGGLGDKLAGIPGFSKSWLGRSLQDLQEWGDEYESDAKYEISRIQKRVGKAFTQGYTRAMNDYKKSRKKKDKGDQNEFSREYQQMLKKYLSKDWLRQQEEFVEALNPDKNGLTEAADLAKARTDAIASAMENMEQKIGSAVDNLASIYDRFKQENEQAFGSLFQGPVMSGLLGDVFRQINDQLRQFGVQIPVPFQILRQDMDQQLAYFKRWRAGLDKLLARGAPLEMIDEIRKMGPEAIPLIEGLLGANPKDFKKYVADFKTGQKLIADAAQSDMNRQLKDWEKHGKDIAWQIINGLASDPAQAKLRAGFRKYVTATFGSVLRAEMATEVADAMAQALRDAADAAAKAPKKIKPPEPPRIDKKTQKQAQDAAKLIPIGQLGMAGARRRLRRTNRELGQLRQGGITEAETAEWLRLRRQAAQLRARIRRLEKERAERQRAEQIRVPGEENRQSRQLQSSTNVTYEGDKVTINASGATPDAVMRALNRQKFKKQSRRRTKRGQRR